MNFKYSLSLVNLLETVCHVPAALDTNITGVVLDSRRVQKGDLFIACAEEDALQGHISQALENGAAAILRPGCDDPRFCESGSAVELCLQDLKSHIGTIADVFFKQPSKDLQVIGVTGTNGKTSVSSYLASCLSLSGKKSAVVGTLGYGMVGVNEGELKYTGYTTPDVVELHRILAELRDDGAHYVAMEVSSHGLSQGRVDCVRFAGAVFTNLSRDHLDYHGSMESYAQAKRKLFETKGLRFAVLNQDDKYSAEIKKVLGGSTQVLSYALDSHAADLCVLDSDLSTQGIRALLKTPIGQVRVCSDLLGHFNLANLSAVVACLIALEEADRIEESLPQIRAVPGRMEVLKDSQWPVVVVDYAHTPDALENVLRSANALSAGKLVLVFGCGGDRDPGKRSLMAEVAERYADEIVVTDDNPRNEDPAAIVSDILKGFRQEVSVTHDRGTAIAESLRKASPNDLVLVAGKGHETWQEVKGQRHYFSDVDTVRGLQAKYLSHEDMVRELVDD